MKRILAVVAVVAFALPALAQDDFNVGEIGLGILQKDFDTNSSRFLEYRDIPQGPVSPLVSFSGKSGDLRYGIRAMDATQRDQSYAGFVANDVVRFEASYVGIPHNFGNGGRSLLTPTSETSWQLSDTTQAAYQAAILAASPPSINFTFLNNLVAPGLASAASNIDLKLLRGRTNLAFSLNPRDSRFEVGVNYFHERRSGTRAANGTAFGFSNVVETPEPVRYVTQDVAVNAAYRGSWGVARAGFAFNDFHNAFETFSFDNPFRSTDGSDGSAYLAPGAASRNGPVFGVMALPPDNKAAMETVGTTLKLGDRTRLTADVTLGQLRQNEDPFIAWTTNTAVLTPEGRPATTAPLPAAVLDGKIDTSSINLFLNTRPSDLLSLNARYRRYDHDNKTPRYSLPLGYVRYDAVWEEIPRITVPYGYTNDVFDAYATVGKGAFAVEGGYKFNKVARTFREAEDTREHVFRVAADYRGDWIVLRGMGEFGNRDYSNYHAVEAEEHSFLGGGLPANQTVLRRYDQANRDLRRFGGSVELAPGSGKFTLFGSYTHTKFEYSQAPVECEDVALFPGQSSFCPGGVQSPLGLIDDTYDTFSVEANFAPSERANLYAFYTWEDGDILQNGRQSGGTLNFNPNDVWTANITNRGNTVGGGVDVILEPEKWFLSLFGRYQELDGNNDVYLLPTYSTSIYGTSPLLRQCTSPGTTPCSIAEFDDTELTSIWGSLKYQVAKQWTAAAGVGYEDYSIKDAQTGSGVFYLPGSFFLQADNRDYQAWVGYLRLSYSWQ
jgi:hypothetical protein